MVEGTSAKAMLSQFQPLRTRRSLACLRYLKASTQTREDETRDFPKSDALSEVRHDETGGRFVAELDGVEAELVYRRRAGRIILIHTEVPDALAGRGVGATLVRAAIAFAQMEHLTVIPLCPFARRWLTDHPDQAEGVTIDWDTLPAAESP